MQLCSITPGLTGVWELRFYKISDHLAASGQRRSSAVTKPWVTSLIFLTCTADGARLPRMYRLMDAAETPTAAPKAACERPFSDRNSAKVMTIHYHHGKESQGRITALVTDMGAGFRYLYGMNIELDRLVNERCERDGISAAKFARRVKIPESRLSEYRKGKRSMPKKHAAALAKELGVTPFDVDPNFGKDLLDTIPNKEQREFHRLSLKRTFELQNLANKTGG